MNSSKVMKTGQINFFWDSDKQKWGKWVTTQFNGIRVVSQYARKGNWCQIETFDYYKYYFSEIEIQMRSAKNSEMFYLSFVTIMLPV